MATYKTCDLCEKELMATYSDSSYKVTVKKLSHFYDGYAPWVGKQRIEFCEDCGFALVIIAKELTPPTNKSLTVDKEI